MGEQGGGLVDDQPPPAGPTPGGRPHVAADPVDGQRPQLLGQVADLEHDQRAVEPDRGRPREQAGARVSLQPERESGAGLALGVLERGVQRTGSW
jgi:hypothetical protein